MIVGDWYDYGNEYNISESLFSLSTLAETVLEI